MILNDRDTTLIDVDRVHKNFGERVALDGVSLSVARGEVVVIIGPSGCGKSSLLRALNGLEKIDSGDIRFRGQSLIESDVDWRAHRQRVGMVFQSYDLFPHLNVIDNVLLGPLRVQKRTRAEALIQARRLLERVGLADRERSWPRELSGGQKQRIAIVRALMMNPEALLLDEITAALDPEMVREVLDVVRGLAAEGMTMVIVSHEMRFARQVADRIVFMDGGQIREVATPEAFFAHPATERARRFLDRFEEGSSLNELPRAAPGTLVAVGYTG
jgi:polar amino acid transport system ATP-binding protein